MRWIHDVSLGDWLRERLDPSWRDMHIFVPHGFEAYARIFHPVTRDRPADTKTWHGHALDDQFTIEEEKVTWVAVADTFGTPMHALAQYQRLIAGVSRNDDDEVLDTNGWRYLEPAEGNLDPAVLAAVAGHLVEHTSTPDTGVAGIWEGNGWWNASAGYVELTEYSSGQDSDLADLPLIHSRPAPVPRLELPDRNHTLCRAGARAFTHPGWMTEAPWGRDGHAESPSLLWPDDQAWVLVTEVDYDSTIVAGSLQLITNLVRDPAIEALIIREGTDLGWDSDDENRPADPTPMP